jgi:serine/threonine-protein kinase
MKRILHEYEDDAGVLKRFDLEIGAIAKLDHDNIVTVTDAGSDHQGRYLVMDFIQGESLYQLLNREQLAENRAVEIFQGLCEGVDHAHENDVIHRDIKPANVMINKRGRPILVDFGLARDEELSGGTRHTMSNMGMGTRYYTAPEQKRDAKSADERSDIYSLGATFFHLLTHEHPDPLDVTEVSARWQGLITRCCKRRPKDRYQKVSELQQAVQEALESSTPEPVDPVGKDEDDLSCPSCQRMNLLEARFCRGCTASLQVTCPACDSKYRVGLRHCDKCGANVASVVSG